MREKLLKTIYKLLNDRPLTQITIEEIAEEAGVSRQTIYRHLGNKSNIEQLINGDKHNKLDTRSEILASAYRIFSRFGFSQSSLEQVAHEAGFSKGAVYGNFKSKEELFIELIDLRLQQQVTFLSGEMENIMILDNPEEGLANFFEIQLKYCESDPSWPKIVLEFMVHSRNQEVLSKLILAQNQTKSQIVGLLQQMRTEGKIADDINLSVLTIMTTALLDGLIMAWNLNPNKILTTYAQDIAYILWHGISPRK
ncbi:TetR/AcrR family transcriptional regulator [Filobacillus milosensis]|nr:TetR/AcrR family transcriptional regulator [Filobacillus milosensis]